jgi:hypothetical protein
VIKKKCRFRIRAQIFIRMCSSESLFLGLTGVGHPNLDCDLDKTVCCLDELLWTLPIFKCPGLLLYVVRGRVVCMWTFILGRGV